MAAESKIEKYLVKRVKELKGEIRKVKWVGRRGAPDRMAWVPPSEGAFIELKAPGKPLDRHQIREHKKLMEMGFRVLKIDSIEDVDIWIEYG